jgi:hypothetical protein
MFDKAKRFFLDSRIPMAIGSTSLSKSKKAPPQYFDEKSHNYDL